MPVTDLTPSHHHCETWRYPHMFLNALQGNMQSSVLRKSPLGNESGYPSGQSESISSQLLHPYMTTGKTIALTRWTIVGKVMSLLFSILSRLVIVFIPRSKRLLISWLQSPSAVNWEPKNIRSVTVSTVSPSICHEVMGPDVMILVFWMLSFSQLFHSPLSLSSEAL